MKHSNVFYRRLKDSFQPVENAKIVRNKLGFDLFRDGYKLCEGKTGYSISNSTTKGEMDAALKKLESEPLQRAVLKAKIEEIVEKKWLVAPI